MLSCSGSAGELACRSHVGLRAITTITVNISQTYICRNACTWRTTMYVWPQHGGMEPTACSHCLRERGNKRQIRIEVQPFGRRGTSDARRIRRRHTTTSHEPGALCMCSPARAHRAGSLAVVLLSLLFESSHRVTFWAERDRGKKRELRR